MNATIYVRYYGQTHIARLNGTTASCTASPEAAARAVAEKAGLGKHVELRELPSPSPFRYQFEARTQESE